MSDVIISIPGATDVTVENAAASSVVVTFPASNNFVTTIIDRGILYGVTGAQGPTGPQGSQGIQGIPGIGIAAGGSIGQILKKNSATDYDTSWLTLDKTAVGLSNVDNTSDLLKPISTATQTALNGKQNLATNLTSISALTFGSTSFVKMTAAGTFALDTNTYLTAETDTLASVTGRGATTTTAVTMGKLTTTGSITAASAIARGVYMNNTLVAAANNDVLVGLDVQPTFTVGSFTGVKRYDIGFRPGAFIGITNAAIYTFYLALNETAINANGASGYLSFQTNGDNRMRMFGTGNLVIQNGGTFTDAGYRLDVVGADSRFNGIRAGLGAGQVAGNTVFGDGALGSNATGTGIVAIGYQALQLSTANNGTAVGYQALKNTTAAGNTAIGWLSGSAITTGQNNTAIGSTALLSLTTGSNNMAVGTGSLNKNVDGNSNVAIGLSALNLGTSIYSNVAIGQQSLEANTTSNNTAIGTQSAQANTSAQGIVAIGYQSLKASTGAANTAVGYQSLLTHTTGTNNTALGHLTASGNFSGCLILGKDATATANNQFVVGSSAVNAGAVTTEVNTSSQVWNVRINGTNYKILLA